MDRSTLNIGEVGSRVIAVGGALAILGLGVAVAVTLRGTGGDAAATDLLKTHFYHAYLVAYMFFLGITLASLFFVMVHHLARAGWSTTVRRVAEGFAGNFWLMLILLLPIIKGMYATDLAGHPRLYEWMNPDVTNPKSGSYDEVIAGKSFFLSHSHFWVFFLAYFAIWLGLSTYLRRQSVKQDQSGDPKLSNTMAKVSAPGMMLFAFSATGMWFQLLMALNPHWFSTMWGVYLFAGSVLSFFAILNLTCQFLQANGKLPNVITREHYHDLGKFTFAFTFFWGYIAFSQFMLIWYANLPEETQFYFPRQIGNWLVVGLVLIFAHVLIPFGGLLSRHAKRGLGVYAFWSIWIVLAELLNMFWIVMPATYANRIPEWTSGGGTPLPMAQALREFVSPQNIYMPQGKYMQHLDSINYAFGAMPMVITVSLILGVGGLYAASTALMMRNKPLLAVRDPHLPEALAFENI